VERQRSTHPTGVRVAVHDQMFGSLILCKLIGRKPRSIDGIARRFRPVLKTQENLSAGRLDSLSREDTVCRQSFAIRNDAGLGVCLEIVGNLLTQSNVNSSGLGMLEHSKVDFASVAVYAPAPLLLNPPHLPGRKV